MNQTLAIIKPDAMKKDNMNNIKEDIIENGFSILNVITNFCLNVLLCIMFRNNRKCTN